MDLDVLELITYITLGTLVYYFLIELAKPKEGAQKWVAIFFVFAIALLLIYLAYIYFKKDDKKENKSETKDEEEEIIDDTRSESEEAPTEFVQGDYKSDKKEFVILNQVSLNKNSIEYEDFKCWYLTPEFLEKYTEAIGEALHIKKKRLLEVKKQYAADLKALKSGEKPKEGIAAIISNLKDKNDDLKMLESTIMIIAIYSQRLEKEKLICRLIP